MALESNIYALWAGKQTAKGTPLATATKRLVQTGGDLGIQRDDGSQNFSDLDRFGDMTDYVNTIVGQGSPTIQGTPDVLSYLFWLFFGQETVTGAADPWTHTHTPGTNGGFWAGIWKRVGANTVIRDKFNDCRISGFAMSGSSADKVVSVTPTILSLDPGVKFVTDPVAAIPTEDPYLYTDAKGTFSLAGTIFPGQSAFTLTWDEGLSPYYGDDVVPVDLIVGNATITCAITILVDTAGLQEYNLIVYGTAAPADLAKPVRYAPTQFGAYTFQLDKKDIAGAAVAPARQSVVTVPQFKIAPDVAIPPNPDGGAVELALAGSMRKVAGQPAVTIANKVGVAAYTV